MMSCVDMYDKLSSDQFGFMEGKLKMKGSF